MQAARGLLSHRPIHPFQHKPCWITVAALLLALMLATPLLAQRGLPPLESRSMENRFPGAGLSTRFGGTITSGDRPAAGASIELQSISTGQAESTQTQEDGSFEFNDVQPGEYLVIARFGQYQVQNEVSIASPAPELHIQMPGRQADRKGGASVSAGELQVPSKAREAYQEAQNAAQHGDSVRALAKLNDALVAAPQYAEALTMRAALRLQAEQIGDALNDAQAAVHADPGYATGFFMLASVLNRQSQFADAEHAAAMGLQRAPQAWQGHFELGGALEGENRPAEALKELNVAVQSAPENFPGVHLVRAIALIGLRQYADAQKDLAEVVRREPQGAAASMARQLLAQINAAQAATTR